MKKETVLSPGAILEQLLVERGMRNTHLAALLGRSPQYVTDIIKGKKALDVELALQLEKAFGGTPDAQTWMKHAISYHKSSTSLTRMEVLERRYAKELIKLKWIDGEQSPEELARDIDAFWDDAKKAVGNFKQGIKKPDADARAAWSTEVYRRATKKPGVAQYDEKRLPELITKLQALMAEERDVMKVPALLAEYGIRLVLLPNPPKCAVDGVGSYNDGKPYIGLSLRIARVDSFWFTLMHEIMHIKAKDQGLPADTIDRPSDDPVERKANEGARQLLMPDDRYNAFVERGVFTLPAVEAEAAKKTPHALHRAILLGRLKNDLHLDWCQFAREHPGVRDILIAAGS